jgi:hypothetical protein
VEDKGGKMTEKKMYRLLNEFANEHLLAKDVNIEVTSSGKSFKAKTNEGAGYNDAVLLGDLIRGAESFLYWARRKGKI